MSTESRPDLNGREIANAGLVEVLPGLLAALECREYAATNVLPWS